MKQTIRTNINPWHMIMACLSITLSHTSLAEADSVSTALLATAIDKKNQTATQSNDEATKQPPKKIAKATTSCLTMSKSRLNKRAKPYQASISKHAKRYQVDEHLIKSVIAAESCYNRTAVSPKNAQGLMQLIPDTAKRFGVTNTFNADQNIRGGTRYLRFLLKRYKGNLIKAIASYNAGEGAVDKYKGVPPYKETKQYVKNVLRVYGKLSGRFVNSHLSDGITLNSNGRVSSQYLSPFVAAKPGRAGLAINKAKAPHLYKQ